MILEALPKSASCMSFLSFGWQHHRVNGHEKSNLNTSTPCLSLVDPSSIIETMRWFYITLHLMYFGYLCAVRKVVNPPRKPVPAAAVEKEPRHSAATSTVS